MNKIPAKVHAELNRQFNQELSAAHSYRALSLWCDDQNLKGFARYFAKQAGEELMHAGRMTTHLIDRGELPETTAIAAPKCNFKEEAWCLEMVERVERASCAGGLSDLDRHIERYLEDEVKTGD
jgi:ferritin